MASKRYSKQEVMESLEVLRAAMPPGTEVYTILRHVAASGMSRSISVHTFEGGEPRTWTYHVARVLGYALDKRDGLLVGGCGMDMGFHVVNSLSYALHGRETVGRKAKRAASKGHPFAPSVEEFRAGYSLTQRWL